MKTQLFITINVMSLQRLESAVLDLLSKNNAMKSNAYHPWKSGVFVCDFTGRIFKIASVKRVHAFKFSSKMSDKTIIEFVAQAIKILQENVPKEYLLLDTYGEAIAILR